MKTQLLLLCLLLTPTPFLWAQRPGYADTLVDEGRFLLTLHDLTNANVRFRHAVAISQNHETANALYAVTRLLVLPTEPAGKGFLDRIGVSSTGRNIYQWITSIPKDANGVTLAPAGVSANEFTAILQTNVLPQIAGAAANLARIVNTGFLLHLTSDETTIHDVTLDYGDLLLLRAGLHALEYYSYTITAWNLDAQLTAIRSLHTNNVLTAGRLLADYPQLFTFATTADLNAGKTAFQNFVDRYLEASNFIRNRSTNVTRLFNYDAEKDAEEQKFRQTLIDLKSSLNSVVRLSYETNHLVNLGRQFDGASSLRSLLPAFSPKYVVLGTLPDATFGGLVPGLTRTDLEEWWAIERDHTVVPKFNPAERLPNGQSQVSLNVLRGRPYTLEFSPDLRNWLAYTNRSSPTNILNFTQAEFLGGLSPKVALYFFTNGILPLDEALSLPKLFVRAKEAFSDNLTRTFSFTAPASGTVIISTIGSSFDTVLYVYAGTSLSALTVVASDDDSGGNLTSQVSFSATAGTTYQIAVDGFGGDSGTLILNYSLR